MAQDIVSGLFGASPMDVALARQKQQEEAAMAYAQRSPIQQFRASLFNLGGALGEMGGKALGLQDPMMVEAQQRQQQMAGIDMTNPESILQAAQNIQDPQLKLRMVMVARQMAADKAKADAERAKALKEQRGIGDVSPKDATPESLQKFAETGNYSDLQFVTADGKPVKVGETADTKEVLYANPATGEQFVIRDGQKVPYSGGTYQKPAMSINMPAPEKAGRIKMAELDAKRVDEMQAKSDAAMTELGHLQSMAAMHNNQMYSGAFASGRAGVANFFNTMGLASPQEASKLATTQTYAATAENLLLARIKQLGVNPTDNDTKIIKGMVPNLERSPEARQQLLNYMAQVAQETVDEADNMRNYYETHDGSLAGYKPKRKFSSANVQAALRPKITPAQAQAEYERRQREGR